MFCDNILVVARDIVSCSLVPTVQEKGPAPVGVRLAPTLGRVNQSPVYCLRLRLPEGSSPGLESSRTGAPASAYRPVQVLGQTTLRLQFISNRDSLS